MSKIYYNILERQVNVTKLYETGIAKGKFLGFECTRDLYTVKLGCTTYIMGAPTAGKSSFWFEILVNLSEFYGWKHAIFSPETGNIDEVIAELCWVYMKKPFFKSYNGMMNEKELYRALTWLNEHFIIVDPEDGSLTIPGFYDAIKEIEMTDGNTIHTTTIDPYNELTNDMSEHNNRQDLYIEYMLGYIRRDARKNNRHNCVITHAASQMPITKDGITYYPPPTARDYAGGQAWYRKGLGMIALWRPPFGLNNEHGIPYKENELHVIVQKAKPKGIGKKGYAKLYYDTTMSRFYEESAIGGQMFAHTDAPVIKAIKPNIDFTEPAKDNIDDIPF